MTNIDPMLYEAASIDGADRFRVTGLVLGSVKG